MKSSNSSSHSFKSPYLCTLYCSINLLLNITIAKEFKVKPLNRLPTNELCRNISRSVVLSIDDFGAKGNGFTDDTKSLQEVWKAACSSSSKAKIVIPAGKGYLVRPSNFSGPCLSKVTLKVAGFIVAPRDPSLWEGLDVNKWLYFHGVNHLKVEGGGFIDGMGKEWWKRSCKTNVSNEYKKTELLWSDLLIFILQPCTYAPKAVTFDECQNLKVKNINFFNSQQMHLMFSSCKHVSASGVNIVAPSDSPNTDGIHINASTDVKLNNIAIRTGDDCISIISNSSRIRVKNVFCGAGHGISIGSLGKNNSYSSVEDVVVDGAILFDTTNGVRIKSWQGGSGFARKIKFENIWMNNVSNPIIINQYYCDSPLPCANQTSAVKIESVTFRGIRGTSATEHAIVLACSDSHPCKKIYFKNIELSTSTGTAKSFIWEAYGKSSGFVQPTPCFSSGDIICKSNSTSSRA